jgi:hypothetical protein
MNDTWIESARLLSFFLAGAIIASLCWRLALLTARRDLLELLTRVTDELVRAQDELDT